MSSAPAPTILDGTAGDGAPAAAVEFSAEAAFAAPSAPPLAAVAQPSPVVAPRAVESQAEALSGLIHALEELDDVQHVHTNAAWRAA